MGTCWKWKQLIRHVSEIFSIRTYSAFKCINLFSKTGKKQLQVSVNTDGCFPSTFSDVTPQRLLVETRLRGEKL